MKKILTLNFVLAMVFTGCKIDKSLLNDTKNDDISFLFTDKPSHCIFRFFSQYNAFEDKIIFYCNEDIIGVKFASNMDRNASGKGYFLVNGMRATYANTKDGIEVAEVYSKPKVNIQFIGDTLGLQSFGPKEMEVPAPFKFMNLSTQKVKKGEDLIVNWNTGYHKNSQVLIQLNYNDWWKAPANTVAETNKILEAGKWTKITEDDGEFVINTEVFEKLPFKGNYTIDIFRASNLVEEDKKRIDVSLVAQAHKKFDIE